MLRCAMAHDAADPLARYAAEFHHPYDAEGRKLTVLRRPLARAAAEVGRANTSNKSSRTGGVWEFSATWPPSVPGSAITNVPRRALAELVGADRNEVVAMNSLTINLHLMMVSFFRPDAQRNCVLIESSAFPSDRYAVVSQLKFHGLDAARNLIEVEPRAGQRTLRTEDLIDRIDQGGFPPGAGPVAGRAISHRPGAGSCRP